ncbi:MAG: TIR domain-containing protein [Pseudomonadota bacterium]
MGKIETLTLNAVPASLDTFSVIILNSLMADFKLDEELIIKFVQQGGGILCVHDTLFPGSGYMKISGITGVRLAFEAITNQPTDQAGTIQAIFHLAVGNPNDPLMRFPVVPVKENSSHPILHEIPPFELAEEFWAINTAPGVRNLLTADVGDRIPCHSRFWRPVTVCGCTEVGDGRIVFFLLGHFPQTYEHPVIQQLFGNCVNWLAKNTHEKKTRFDVFLSHSDRNTEEAEHIADKARERGISLYSSARDLSSGDTWAEEVRQALLDSREMAVIVSKDSLKSEWVITEWGIAWALQRRITPILHRCDIDQLPDRLKNYEARDLYKIDDYLDEVISRGGGAMNSKKNKADAATD